MPRGEHYHCDKSVAGQIKRGSGNTFGTDKRIWTIEKAGEHESLTSSRSLVELLDSADMVDDVGLIYRF